MKTTPIPAPKKWQELKPHPLSALIDFGIGIDMKGLADHIRRNGYDEHESIVIFEDKILDGRHKHRGAIDADVIPTFRQFLGSHAQAVAYVAKKIHRQHLDESQRAMLAGNVANISHGGDRGKVQISTLKSEQVSISDAARAANVSPRSVKSAKKVIDKGSEELKSAVLNGHVAVSAAAEVIDAPQKFCRPCRVGVPKKNCPECKKARGEFVASKPHKSGHILFDDRQVDDLIGKIMRSFDAKANAYGLSGEHGKCHKECVKAMEAVLVQWKRWQLLTK